MGRSRSRSRSRSAPRSGGSAPAAGEVLWYQYASPQGYPYYHSPQMQQTVWERPTGPGDKIVDQSQALALPGAVVEWMRCIDPHGRTYYHQAQTQQTVWELPAGPNVRVVDHPALPPQAAMMSPYGAPAANPYGMYAGIPGMPAALPGYFGAPGMPGMMPGMAPGMAGGDGIDLFCLKNKLDASAAAKLRTLPLDLQRQVMDRGDLLDARNPNAVLMGRIRDAERGGSQPAQSFTSNPSVEEFIRENRIDPSAGDKLRALSEDIQRKVMERGNLTDARNPNAMLMGRIKDAQNSN